jgi:apolipoprotein N-acyltransferase
VGFGPLAFLALIPLVWLVRSVRPRRAVFLGFAFGFGYFASLLYWVIQLTGLGWGALSLTSSAYPALFALLAPVLWRDEHPVRSVFGLAALWTGTEYLRALWPLGGFTWGGLGYSQTGDGLLLPLASITGVWGVSFVVALVNGLVLVAVERVSAKRLAAAGGLAAIGLAAVTLPALTPIHAATGKPLDVAIVQGNDVEARLQSSIRIGVIAAKHATLHIQMRGDPPDLAVWPEDAVDVDPTLDPNLRLLVTTAIREVGAPTLVGAITGPDSGPLYNESLLYDGQGRIVGRYAKTHLVPFGEYVPWRDALSFISALDQIPRDLTPGPSRQPLLHVDGVTFANVICFENTFPSLDRRLVDRGAGFLVVSTNNASYGRTAASRQHLAMSQLRAVENGRWVVHAAVSGISAFIDPHGVAHRTTGLYERTIDRGPIRASTARTIYTRWGDWFAWTALVMSGLLLLAPRRRGSRGETAQLAPGFRTLVILPTYDERATIEEVLHRVLEAAPEVDVLVVDDSSPDGTALAVRTIAARDMRVRLLERPAKGGLAGAYVLGFGRALEEGYDVVVEMDADLSHQPEELPRLLEGAARNDLTVGSRYIRGGGVTNWGLLRRALSRGGNLYTQLVLGVPVRDATSGFRAFRVGLLRQLVDEGIHADGYGFQVELAYRAWRAGYVVGEVPITFREREHGTSKISRRIVVEALWLVTLWGIRDRLGLGGRRRASTPVQPHEPLSEAQSQRP